MYRSIFHAVCFTVVALFFNGPMSHGQETSQESTSPPAIKMTEPVVVESVIQPLPCTSTQCCSTQCYGVDLMDTRNFRLIDYRRMFKAGRAPTVAEMQGRWRGVNKGVVNLAGYNQFIKEIGLTGDVCLGDNVQVHQVSNDILRCMGWQPKIDECGQIERRGTFKIYGPGGRDGIGGRAFRHGAKFSYRDGGNPRGDASKLLVDRVVMIDCNHMLGRATAKFGPINIPLAYFVLERIPE